MNEVYGSDVKEYLEKIYFPHVVEDISGMDGDDPLQFLIAMNNKGYNIPQEEIAAGVVLMGLDPAINYKDLYYFEVVILENKVDYTFWKYPQKTNGEVLETSIEPFKKKHQQWITKLSLLLKHFNLTMK